MLHFGLGCQSRVISFGLFCLISCAYSLQEFGQNVTIQIESPQPGAILRKQSFQRVTWSCSPACTATLFPNGFKITLVFEENEFLIGSGVDETFYFNVPSILPESANYLLKIFDANNPTSAASISVVIDAPRLYRFSHMFDKDVIYVFGSENEGHISSTGCASSFW